MLLPVSFLALALFQASTHALPASIWHVSVLEAPAPPSAKGPPLSAHALRDRSKLPYEIVGLVAAYVLCLAVAATLLLLGRRLRRRAQTSNQTLSVEMVKPPVQVNQSALGTGPSPISPKRDGAYKPWATSGNGHNYHQSQTSMSTVDEKIVETDKARNMDHMSKLYAAVMAQDELKQPRSTTQELYPSSLTESAPGFHDSRDEVPRGQAVMGNPYGPTPVREYAQPSTRSRSSSKKSTTSPLSFLASALSPRIDSAFSPTSKSNRFSFRKKTISEPRGSADLSDTIDDSEDTPLSPWAYDPGPPPPVPVQKSSAAQAREMARKKGPPAALSIHERMASNSTNSLPFRQTYADSLQSAPAYKTTFLERQENMNSGPKTGVPMTPYSPYQPYTPLTPVTPRRLMTREDMKKNQKKNGLKVLSEDDMVQSEEDMWGKDK